MVGNICKLSPSKYTNPVFLNEYMDGLSCKVEFNKQVNLTILLENCYDKYINYNSRNVGG